MRTDVITTNYGTIIAIEAVSERGEYWIIDNVSDNQLGQPVYAESRYGMDIIMGMLADGLILEDSSSGKLVRQ